MKKIVLLLSLLLSLNSWACKTSAINGSTRFVKAVLDEVTKNSDDYIDFSISEISSRNTIMVTLHSGKNCKKLEYSTIGKADCSVEVIKKAELKCKK